MLNVSMLYDQRAYNELDAAFVEHVLIDETALTKSVSLRVSLSQLSESWERYYDGTWTSIMVLITFSAHIYMLTRSIQKFHQNKLK